MKPSEIETFFQEVSRRISFSIQVILTGGAAGVLMGVERVTYDIDFEVHIVRHKKGSELWDKLKKALEEASSVTRIVPQYAEDIDRWSSIVLPAKKSFPYKKLENVEIRILDPAFWAIGKLTRFISSDVSDLITVLKKSKPSAVACIKLWGEALGKSPRSSAQTLFRKQVEHFIRTYSKTIWGHKTKPEELVELFIRSARGVKN